MVENNIIQVMPINRRLDAVYYDKTVRSKIFRNPIHFLTLIAQTDTSGQVYNFVAMGDISADGDIAENISSNNEFLGVEFDGKEQGWTEEIKRYEEKAKK